MYFLQTWFASGKWIKMVKFKLGNEMWKVNWSKWDEHGTTKKSESPTGINPMTAQTLNGHFFLCSTLVLCWSVHFSHFLICNFMSHTTVILHFKWSMPVSSKGVSRRKISTSYAWWGWRLWFDCVPWNIYWSITLPGIKHEPLNLESKALIVSS